MALFRSSVPRGRTLPDAALAMVKDTDFPTLASVPPGRGSRRVMAAVLQNGSEEPVYDCRAHLELDPAATGNFWKGDRLPPSPGRTLRRYLQRHLRVAAPAAHPRPAARPRHQRPAAQLRRGGARRLDRRTASPQLRP